MSAKTTAVDLKLPYSGKFWTVVAPLARHYIKKLYGAELADRAYQGGKPIYRELVDRAPAIGAGNPMGKNLYLACVIFALWKAADGDITPDMMREVLKALFAAKAVRILAGRGDLRRPENMAKLNETLHANAQWAEDHPNIKDATWRFHFDDDRGGTVAHYHYTRCPINDRALIIHTMLQKYSDSQNESPNTGLDWYELSTQIPGAGWSRCQSSRCGPP